MHWVWSDESGFENLLGAGEVVDAGRLFAVRRDTAAETAMLVDEPDLILETTGDSAARSQLSSRTAQ